MDDFDVGRKPTSAGQLQKHLRKRYSNVSYNIGKLAEKIGEVGGMVVSLFKGKIFLDPRGVPCIYNFAKRKDFVFQGFPYDND